MVQAPFANDSAGFKSTAYHLNDKSAALVLQCTKAGGLKDARAVLSICGAADDHPWEAVNP